MTLRAPRIAIAVVIALALHVLFGALAQRLDVPKKAERIEIAINDVTPAPAASAPSAPAPPPAPAKPKKRTAPPPTTSPVLPELPPSQAPPENRAQLPMAEKAPEPAPPPQPSTWKERLLAELAETTPRPSRTPTGVLAPSFSNLERVAVSDARLHDDEQERRIAEDFGPFFRRGLEALRGNWHPDRVLDVTERDPTKRCAGETRSTFAVATINRAGDVIDVELKDPSGCPELDDEAVAAFKRVAKFPYPPKGIFVSYDGEPVDTARYPVHFVVMFNGGVRLFWN